jgi:carbamate kinase
MLLALGGNAILPADHAGTIDEQYSLTAATMRVVADRLAAGDRVALTHGNGPVVGNILLRNEAAKALIPPMPLHICNADSQGGIGYMVQQVLGNQLRARGLRQDVATVVTQVEVDPADPAFRDPRKPIGPFYHDRGQVNELRERKGWVLREDSGRGHRRVVPSPSPQALVEIEVVRALFEAGFVVIAAGGGGVPVIREPSGALRGVEAVVDKDLSAALLARQLGVQWLVLVTAVDHVSRRFGKPDEEDLPRLNAREVRIFLEGGEFPPGSMGPKMEAALEFLAAGGERVVVCSTSNLADALLGRSGTQITP